MRLLNYNLKLGQINKKMSFSGYKISLLGIVVAKLSFNRMLARFRRLYEQGVDVLRLVKHVNNWIKWAQSRVSLNLKKLRLITSKILQNTFKVQVPLKSI